MRNLSRISIPAICCIVLLGAPGAFAANKDIIALQAQVQQMQELMMTMQQANDERYATMHDLLVQTSQNVAKISGEVDAMQKAVQDQQGNQGNSLQQLSGQMQSMNDSLDELRARLDKIDKNLNAMQSQQQSLAAGQPAMPGQAAPPEAGAGAPGAQPPAPQAPPVDQLYQSAASDYNAAKYNLASQEFGDVIKYYPQSTEAGNSQFYLGEIAYRSGDYKAAIESYSQVLTQYPGSAKAPTAELRKGQAEIALGQREAGIRDLRSLVQRHPQTPEAMQARSKLNGMGVRIYAKPTAARQ